MGVGFSGHRGASELPSVTGAHVILPGAAAALLAGLGTSLPFSALCHSRALAHHGAPLLPLGGGGGCSFGPLGLSDSSLLHFGLSAGSVLGLGGLGSPRQVLRKEPEDREEEEEEGDEGGVLNLSAGVGPRQRDPLSWVVVPSKGFFLKRTAVS